MHGLGGSVANWDAIGPRLATTGRTVALDLPGFGLSPPGPDWQLSTHAAAVTGFIAEFGPSACLIGNSLGGLLVEIVAAEHPATVDSLVLISPATPPVLPDSRIHWPTARRLLSQSLPVLGPAISRHYLRVFTPEQLVDLSVGLVTQNPGHVPMPMIEEFVRLARARSNYPWTAEAAPKTGRSIARMFAARSSFIEMIRDIKAPTLVIQGVADHIVSPTSVEWLCNLRPDWELIQMENTGHTPQMDAPIRLLEILLPRLMESRKREIPA